MSVGFMVAFPLVGAAVLARGWRAAWAGVGLALVLGLAPLACLLVRRTPEAVGLVVDGDTSDGAAERPVEDENSGETLPTALRGGAFWVFALAAAVYGLVASGIGLFNESILAERGFAPALYHRPPVIPPLVAPRRSCGGGWLAERGSLRGLLVAAMVLLAGALIGLPRVSTEAQVDVY